MDAEMKSGVINVKGGPGEGKELRGIYRLTDEILTICFGGPDGRRPDTFACDGPSESLIVLRLERRERAPVPRPGDRPLLPTSPTSRQDQ
jgi:hypothetical protein